MSTRNPARLIVALSVAAVLAVFLLYTAVAGVMLITGAGTAVTVNVTGTLVSTCAVSLLCTHTFAL